MSSTILVLIGFVLPALTGYLLGSINFAIIVSKVLYKQDIRTLGSGNAGMTNVLRNFTKAGAAATLLGDVFKGILSVIIGHFAMVLLAPSWQPLYGAYIGGIFALVGHLFPLYFGFKGGKGVAVTGGVIIAIQPVLAAILLVVFLLVFKLSKMVSLASIVGISLYPLVTLFWAAFTSKEDPMPSFIFSVLISALVVYMHRSNIERILNGTEYKFGQKKK